MQHFQQRFLFYLNRCERLLRNPATIRSELRQYTAAEINIAAGMLFEMCFTNYTLTSEDMDSVGSEHDVNEIYEYKRQKYADELTEVLKKVILEDMY